MEDREGGGRTGGRRDFPIGYWFRVRTHFANWTPTARSFLVAPHSERLSEGGPEKGTQT